MKRDIDPETTPALYHLTDLAPVMEIYADVEFDNTQGQHIPAGNVQLQDFYRAATCSVVDGALSVPKFEDMDVTEDSPTNQQATYSAYLRVAGQEPIPWLLNFSIPPAVQSQTSISWTTLRILRRPPIARSNASVGMQQMIDYVDTVIAQQIGNLNFAALDVLGRTELSTDPLLSTKPIAMSATDPLIPVLVLHTSKYASLDAASAALTSLGGGTLVIDKAAPIVASSVSIPSTTAVRFEGAGQLTGTGKTVNFAGPFIAPLKRIFAAGITATFAGNKVHANYYPEWWWSGSGDALAALQATSDAIDTAGGGNLHLQKNTYSISGTWTIGTASSFHFINICGTTEIGTIIGYAGATNSIAIKLNNEKFTRLANFTVANAVAKGTTEGIRATGSSGGTNTTGLAVSSVGIENFHTGWHTSDGAAQTSSEIAFFGLRLSGNDTGFLNDDFNGLSFSFYNLQMSANTIGIDATTPSIHIFGGSASNNGTDFKFVGDGNNSIIGFYSENATTRFVLFGTQAGSNKLTISGCLARMASPNTATAVEFSGGGGALTISDCNIGGKITTANGALVLKNCGIIDPSNTFTATANPTAMGPGFRILAGSGRFESFGNVQYDGDFNTPLGSWPDCSGVTIDYDGGGSFRAIVTQGRCRGSNVASDTAIVPTGRFFHVTGTNDISSISATGLPIGMEIRIVFDGVLTLTDGSNLKLAGNFVTTANDSIALINDDGTNWLELSRSVN